MQSTARAEPSERRAARRPSRAALVFLRGADADARLRELAAARGAALPVLGALAVALVARRLHEELGYRCVGDWSREKLGVGARTLRDWARVWGRLRELPRLREAVCAGEVSFSVARLVVGVVTPETEAACLASVRGRTLRAVAVMVRAVREAERRAAADPETDASDDDARVRVRLPCAPREAGMWRAAVELARRVAGESLPVWACAERMAGEAASAVGAGEAAASPPARARRPLRSTPEESGLRAHVWPGLRWRALPRPLPPELAALAEGLEECPALEVDRRFRAAIAFLQTLDLELGRILRQVVGRGLHRELGFESFERYVRERLDLAPRTARRRVALARTEQRAPAVAHAFREGRVTAFQASAISEVASRESARRWVAAAERVSLRRLEEELEAAPRAEIVFFAPPEVAAFFLAMVRRVGLVRLLAHAIRTWVAQGERFRDYADFERDGYVCTTPGCTARRGLESHHIWFRSRGGPDAAWNRTTLCQFHHRHAVHGPHAGRLRIHGRAPDGLIYRLGGPGGEVWRSGDVRVASQQTR